MFAYGANYDEKILFGLALGVPILSYEEQKIYREDDRDETVPFFNTLKYEETISTSGSGFNLKAGVIFKPVKWVNIGIAYHSRTRYALTDNFNSSFEYDYTDTEHDGPILTESPDGSFRYNLRTPRTLSGGVGVIIAKSGFISTEIQYKDYGGARFKYTGRGNGVSFESDERAVNNTIQDEFSNALTIRVGGELAIHKFRVRGGVELDQRPYANDSEFDPTFNAGLGFRGDVFFVDLAYQRASQDQGFLPYAVESSVQPFVEKHQDYNRVILTLAYRWK
jgi:long-subunit fatty acid transport protein